MFEFLVPTNGDDLLNMEKVTWRKYILTRFRRAELLLAIGILANFFNVKSEHVLELIEYFL